MACFVGAFLYVAPLALAITTVAFFLVFALNPICFARFYPGSGCVPSYSLALAELSASYPGGRDRHFTSDHFSSQGQYRKAVERERTRVHAEGRQGCLAIPLAARSQLPGQKHAAFWEPVAGERPSQSRYPAVSMRSGYGLTMPISPQQLKQRARTHAISRDSPSLETSPLAPMSKVVSTAPNW